MGAGGSTPNAEDEKDTSGYHTDAAPLSEKELNSRIVCSTKEETVVFGNYTLNYAFQTQRGYYPDALHKPNQDSFVVHRDFNKTEGKHLFCVFDGHGGAGDLCAQFARDNLGLNVVKQIKQGESVEDAFAKAFPETNAQLHKSAVEDNMSGTTAIGCLFYENKILVGNVGDSRAIIVQEEEGGKLRAYPLSIDQTPFRQDERERVKKYGARVMTMDQIQGIEPPHENWGLNLGEELDNDGDPPRIWHQSGDYPGTAFTRSIGDYVAEMLGVVADPEVVTKELTEKDRYIIIASDGVWEFLTSQTVADMVAQFADPLEACKAVVAEAYRLWLQYEVRTDDITMIAIYISDNTAKAKHLISPGGTSRQSRIQAPAATGLKEDSKQFMAGHKNENRPVRRGLSKAKRTAIMATKADEGAMEKYDVQSHAIKKSDEELKRIGQAVKANFLFQHLNSRQSADLFLVMSMVEVKKGDVIIRQGDEGDRFYVVDSGDYEVRVSAAEEDHSGAPETLGEVVHMYRGETHSSFGELALMYSKPRAASVVAATDGLLWALDRHAFRSILMKSDSQEIIKCLRKVQILESLTTHDLKRLNDVLTEVTYDDGDHMITQGDVGDQFYILIQGKAVCTVKIECPDTGAQSFKEVLHLKEFDYFGERALLSDAPRAANVVAVGEVKCLQVNRTGFEECLGPLQDMIDEHRTKREKAAVLNQKRPVRLTTLFQNKGGKDVNILKGVTLLDIQRIALIEEGDFGRVYLAQHLSHHKFFLMKSVSKKEAVEQNHQAAIMNERRTMALLQLLNVKSPFIPNMLATLTDEDSLHLLLDTKVCRPLLSVMQKDGALSPIPEESAKFYSACIILALENMHHSNIVSRAITPEYVMLNDRDCPVLSDFRLAKNVQTGKTFTMCGVPGFLAPEQVTAKGHGVGVDCWAVGVILYEMLFGEEPFEGQNETETYGAITSHKSGGIPDLIKGKSVSVSKECVDILDKLLDPDQDTRLGSTEVDPEGMHHLRDHAWWTNIDWAPLQEGKVGGPEGVKCMQLVESFSKEPCNVDFEAASYDGDDDWFGGF